MVWGVTIALLAAVGVAGASVLLDGSADSADSAEATIHISTAGDSGNTSGFGLLVPDWQNAYEDGQGDHGYDFNGSTNVAEECGNCHMSTGGGIIPKHQPPLHPIAVEDVSGDSYSGEWFYDDGQHRGPETELANQYSGIMPSVQCGACHTATDPSSSFAESGTSLSNDPHSVHRDVSAREGCVRCHSFNNRTFDRTGNGEGGVAFTQGNATRSTYGIANPVNMTRTWDGVFLSTTEEANYSYDAGSGGLSASGTGWSRYGVTESSRASQYGCGDCHDRFHAQQGYADTGGNGLEFAFNDSAGSRKGPYTPVEDLNSIGVDISSDAYFTCGKCHPTDAHAVHSNGLTSSRATFSEVTDASDQSIIDDGVLGAELCDECHSQNIGETDSRHIYTDTELERGLAGDSSSSHNRLPDLKSSYASSSDDNNEDCGFCHKI